MPQKCAEKYQWLFFFQMRIKKKSTLAGPNQAVDTYFVRQIAGEMGKWPLLSNLSLKFKRNIVKNIKMR